MRRTMSFTASKCFRRMATSTLIAFAGLVSAQAQTPAVTSKSALDEGPISLALTFDAAHGSITNPVSFWFYGGGADLTATFYHGLGVSADFVGLHTGNSGNGVPINLLVATFGPKYTHRISMGKHPGAVFGEVLVGEANGFRGVYPQTSGAIPSSNAFALQTGGGLDIGVTRHISVRAIEANWLRSQLPNATTNVQNNFRIGAGVVVHSASR